MLDPYADFVLGHTDQGVPVHALYVPNCDFAHVSFVFHVGAYHDQPAKTGLAHFLEHMVCANDGFDMIRRARFYNSLGGSYHAFTSHFATWYGFKLPVRHQRFDEALDHWLRATMGGNISSHFQHEQSVIESEIRRKYPSELHLHIAEKLNRVAYRDTPWSYAPSPAGTIESVKALSLQDVQSLNALAYTLDNLSIVSVGGIKSDDLLHRLSHKFHLYRQRRGEKYGRVSTVDIPKLSEPKLQFDTRRNATGSSANVLLYTMFPASVDDEYLNILSKYLSLKLVQSLRDERALVYSAHAEARDHVGFRSLVLSTTDFPVSHLSHVTDEMTSILSAAPAQLDEMREVKSAELQSFTMYDPKWQQVHGTAVSEVAMQGYITTRQFDYDRIVAIDLEAAAGEIMPYLVPENLLFVEMLK